MRAFVVYKVLNPYSWKPAAVSWISYILLLNIPFPLSIHQAEDEIMQLVADDLMNPCLDYVENVIFSAPDAVFVAGGKEYRSTQEVRDAFFGGVLEEQAFKEALAIKINELLEVCGLQLSSDWSLQ